MRSDIVITSAALAVSGLLVLCCVVVCVAFASGTGRERHMSRFWGRKLLRQDKMPWKDDERTLIIGQVPAPPTAAQGFTFTTLQGGWSKVPSR